MSAPSGYDYQQSMLPAGQGAIQPMSGGGTQTGGADVNAFWQLLLKSCSKAARDFTVENKALVKTTETKLR